MVRKKLDERIRSQIEKSLQTNERNLFIIVGDHGKDQIPNLHYLQMRSNTDTNVRLLRPKVLWCYKKDLGFSTHKKKVSFFSGLDFSNIF